MRWRRSRLPWDKPTKQSLLPVCDTWRVEIYPVWDQEEAHEDDVVKRRGWWAESESSTLRRTSRRIPKGSREKELFWLEERRKRLRKYDTNQRWGSTQLLWSTKSRKEWVRSTDGNDRVCNSLYDKMVKDETRYNLPRGSRIDTPHLSVHLQFPCITVRPCCPVHLRHPYISIHPL